MFLRQLLFRAHLEPEEVILYAVHKHTVAITGRSLKIVFLGIVFPWVLYFMLLKTPIGFWLAIIWSGVAFFRFVMAVLDWYSDVFLVTNQCVIIIDWVNFFNHGAARIDYPQIEGVAYRINGFLPMVLGYGELTLKVSSGNNFVLNPANKPKQAEMEIARHQQDFINGKEKQDTDQLKDLLSSMVARHFSER